MPDTDFRLRPATPRDADEIARTHRDSIETIGRHFYVAEIVSEWRSGLTPDLYRRAMEHGEVFFIAVDEHDRVLGFSTHRVDGSQHGTAVYVRGSAARRGVGSALNRLAEASAVSTAAESIEIDASLAAVEFYKAHGFEETGRGDHRLRSGRRCRVCSCARRCPAIAAIRSTPIVRISRSRHLRVHRDTQRRDRCGDSPPVGLVSAAGRVGSRSRLRPRRSRFQHLAGSGIRGLRSRGAVAYKSLLAEAGLAVIGEYEDEGENHYFDAAPRQAPD